MKEGKIIEEVMKIVKNVKTRDNIGGFKHIEVYKDEILAKLSELLTPNN